MPPKSLLHSTRSALRQQVTKKCNSIESNISLMSDEAVNANISALNCLKERLDDANQKVLNNVWSQLGSDDDNDAVVCSEMDTWIKYDENLSKTLSLLKSRLSSLAGASSSLSHSNISQLKLPELPLPSFSNKEGEDISKFFREFEATVSRYNLSTHVKFTLLTRQLSSDPLKLVNSLECSKRSYEDAKELLQEAFADRLSQQYGVIKQMSELQLTYQSDPYEFISNMKIIIDQVNVLGIDVTLILQYFIWNGFNDCFKNQLIQITGFNKPSLLQIQDNIFTALERYKNVQKKFERKEKPQKSPKASTTLASAVNLKTKQSKIKECSLCLSDHSKKTDHPIFKCSVYVTPESKIEKLEQLNHCTKCAYSHSTSDCKFRFHKRCINCQGWHFNYLCRSVSSMPKNISHSSDRPANFSKNKNSKQNSSPSSVTSSLMWSESRNLQISCNPFTAMPSFSLNDSGDRGIKDSGSQLSFVVEDWAKDCNFEVIDYNYSLTVNGINSSRPISTKVYKVRLGNEYFPAVAMHAINIVLDLPGVSEVAQAFINKGYELADKFLPFCGDKIDNIKLLLGNDNAHLVLQNDVLFGGEFSFPSVFLNSAMGVMLIGDIERYKENLRFLPSKVFTSTVDSHEEKLNPPLMSEDCDSENEMEDYDLRVPVHVDIAVLDENGHIIESELERATEEILSSNAKAVLNYDLTKYNELSMEENDKLVRHVLENTSRDSDGRLVMPLIWNGKVAHLLGKNQNLAKAILKSNFKKYSKKNEALTLIDSAFKEQEQLGIIKRIDNLNQFLEENPQYSFLPHMPVFKMDRETTKCRNVYLSNLCEPVPSNPMTVSHNQAIFSGPCLNRKISTSILQLRFNTKLLCFDLKKAFLMIKLNLSDQSKLLFYWYRNVLKGDFSLVAYKNCRLPFGLTCSPTLLMLALYRILILDAKNDNDDVRSLKKEIYNLAYMDNLAYSANDSLELRWAYSNLEAIFAPYQFSLQQFITNDTDLQRHIDQGEVTPSKVKLLGLIWDRENDTILTQKLALNQTATTKRTILSSIASNFDVFSFYGPLLNRARLFMHRLQCMKELGWDDRLGNDQQREWSNICKQVNSTPEIPISRFVGQRDEPYKLIAFCDASKDIYGAVLYIQNLRSNNVNFLLSKNRMVGRQLENKSIPSLEFQAVSLGTETLIDTYKELCGPMSVNPIKIMKLEVFTDSAVALNWLNSYVNRFDKMRKRSVFVMNRLHHIEKLCEVCPVTFKFCAGMNNPADCITRPLSYKLLMKTKYYTGPEIVQERHIDEEILNVTIPNPLTCKFQVSESQCDVLTVKDAKVVEIPLSQKASEFNFSRRVSIYKSVLIFINNLKLKLKKSGRYGHFEVLNDDEISQRSNHLIILFDQKQHFPDVFEYLQSKNPPVRDMPNIMSQLNLFMDKFGILRVKCKFTKWKDGNTDFPILLAKNSRLTEEIILKFHRNLAHSGIYSTLSEIRKKFWIPCHFSTIKKVLKTCIHCRRYNGKTIRLNQSPYRNFRINPPTVPYRYIFLDYFGPYWVRWDGKKTKAWVLCITCLWSRAINLKLCVDMSVNSFLRALQLHCFEYGIPELCLSDQGSQLTAGGQLIMDYLNDVDTQSYFAENKIKPLTFQQYYKGHNELGSLVESCVKMAKRLIQGSIGNMILTYLEFDFAIQHVVHILNRRPIAFKEYLRSGDVNESIPSAITPEILVKGHELNSLNIIPHLHPLPTSDPTWIPNVSPVSHAKDSFYKLRKAREALIDIYNNEFLAQLMTQATDKKSRYKPVLHQSLQIGDIVLIKEPHLKPTNFPMGIVKEIQINSLGEVTGATILKGRSKEITKRHSSSLIPLLSRKEYGELQEEHNSKEKKESKINVRPMREASIIGQQKTKDLMLSNLV